MKRYIIPGLLAVTLLLSNIAFAQTDTVMAPSSLKGAKKAIQSDKKADKGKVRKAMKKDMKSDKKDARQGM